MRQAAATLLLAACTLAASTTVAKNCVIVTAGAGATGGTLSVTASGVRRDFQVSFGGSRAGLRGYLASGGPLTQ